MATLDPSLDPTANRANLVYIPAAVFVAVCPVLVGLRLWARHSKSGRINSDDWAAIAALIFSQLLDGFLVAACRHGMGRHFKTLSKEDKFHTMMYFFMAQVVYKIAINMSKVCILLLYLRIFETVRWFRASCWFLLASVAAYCIGSVVATIFQCNPINKAFNKSLPGVCINMTKFWYANAGFSISTDIIILLLPWPLVYKLQITLGQKIGLMGIFAVGIFVVITSCLRITSLDILATTPDVTYDIENVMWTIIEPNMAVVCACLPILRPFLSKIIPALRTKSFKSKYGNPASDVSNPRQPGNGHSRDKAAWEKIGKDHSEGYHMTSIERLGVKSDSEEHIAQSAAKNKEIHRTVEYTVQYGEPHAR